MTASPSNLPESHPEPLPCPFCGEAPTMKFVGYMRANIFCASGSARCGVAPEHIGEWPAVLNEWNHRASSEGGAAPTHKPENSVRTSEVGTLAHGESMSEPRERSEFYRKLNAAIDHYASSVRGANHAQAAMDAALDEAEREYVALSSLERDSDLLEYVCDWADASGLLIRRVAPNPETGSVRLSDGVSRYNRNGKQLGSEGGL